MSMSKCGEQVMEPGSDTLRIGDIYLNVRAPVIISRIPVIINLNTSTDPANPENVCKRNYKTKYDIETAKIKYQDAFRNFIQKNKRNKILFNSQQRSLLFTHFFKRLIVTRTTSDDSSVGIFNVRFVYTVTFPSYWPVHARVTTNVDLALVTTPCCLGLICA